MARAIIEHSREVWLAADHSKFNRPAMVELARLDADRHAVHRRRAAARRFPSCSPRRACTLRDLRRERLMTRAMTYLLALDQGTSSSRSIVFDARRPHRRAWRSASSGRSIRSPAGSSTTRRRSGAAQLATAREALAKAGARRPATSPRSASPTSARRRWSGTARPASRSHNAIVWQDRRTEPTVRRSCASEGLEPTDPRADRAGRSTPTSPAPSSRWLLDNVPGARAAARARRARLRHRRQLADLAARPAARVHATDVEQRLAHACCSTSTRNDWDDELLRAARRPARAAARGACRRAHVYGRHAADAARRADPDRRRRRRPAERAVRPGLLRAGHGQEHLRHRLLHADEHRRARSQTSANGLLTTSAAQAGGATEYALEGSVFIGGAVVQWLRDGLQRDHRPAARCRRSPRACPTPAA